MATAHRDGFKDHTLALRVTGAVMLVAGAGMAYLAIIEAYCFYLFGESGRFGYPGFGFGSFMFGNIAAQIVCYYTISATLVGLGYAHLRLRRWGRVAALALFRAWLVIGLPIVLGVLAILLASKELSVALVASAALCLLLSYAVLPWLAIRFYGGPNARRSFEQAHGAPAAIEAVPMPILALTILFALYILAMHLFVLFNGLFPLFGRWLTGLRGIQAVALSILALAAITWGGLARRRWAWWAAMIYFALLTSSALCTLATSSYLALLRILDFPAYEVDFLDGLPLQGTHLAALAGLPLVLTLLMIVGSRRHFYAANSQPVNALQSKRDDNDWLASP